MADGPTVRRRRLGAELRRLRVAHGFKLDEIAGRLGVVASTLSRIEKGKAPIRTSYLRNLLDWYEVTDPGAKQLLVDMAREGHRKGWWADYDDVLPSGFDVFVGLEAEAKAVRVYEANFVPGLLQTRDYAMAILHGLHPRDSEEQIERLVELRLLRQRKLDEETPLDLWLILDEAAIRRCIGGSVVMRRQLEHLIKAGAWPNVGLQILPFEAGAHAGLDGPFSILQFDLGDPDVACIESAGGIVYLEKDREVRSCAEVFDRLRASALSPEASVALLDNAITMLN
ncbi:MAG TPA: helix-turn-helix transcriptional regulator [Streptosporangiaceae bacterium]|nr:helix-turn-helix transcriptional regulator [Streptosporangiaceae bacterium]